MKKRVISLAITALMVLSLVACGTKPADSTSDSEKPQSGESSSAQDAGETSGDAGGDTAQGNQFPFSEEKIELTIARAVHTGVRPSANDVWIWKDFEQKTNIKINWEELTVGLEADQKIALKLATGDLPDAFYQLTMPTSQIAEAGAAGSFIAINDLVQEHAPNIRQMFADNPGYKKVVTMPDGNMYSLPYVMEGANEATIRWYVKQGALDELGLEKPKTLVEFDNYLRKYKEAHPSHYPLSMPGKGEIFEQVMAGAYGLGNTGIQGVAIWTDLGPDGNVRFYRTDSRYKEMLQLYADWYKDGIMHPEQFTDIELARWQNMGTSGEVAALCWVHSKYLGEEAGEDFVGISQFEGPYGDSIMSWADAPARGAFSFVITSANKYPVETMKWVDYWYGEEGYMYAALGTENETYRKDGDSYVWSDEIQAKVDELGRQVGPFQFLETWYGGWEPQIYGMKVSDENQKKLLDLKYYEDPAKMFKIDPQDVYSHLPADRWTTFVPTEEESIEIEAIRMDMKTYLDETTAKFITGALSLETDWDTYVKNLDAMGVPRYLELRQQQYERYLAS